MTSFSFEEEMVLGGTEYLIAGDVYWNREGDECEPELREPEVSVVVDNTWTPMGDKEKEREIVKRFWSEIKEAILDEAQAMYERYQEDMMSR